jgi:predicted membrane protein (TIGR00267 family)
MDNLTRMILSRIREVIFGLEDGLVSTLGVITGIAVGTQDRFVIILSGIVLVAVESLSMAAGTYLSNKSEAEANLARKAKHALHKFIRLNHDQKGGPTKDALAMGVAYIMGGAVPIVPYLILPIQTALFVSIIATITTLFLVGVGKAKLTQTDPLQSGFEMVTVSLSAAVLGFVIGKMASVIFPNMRTM